jgi:tape measure domain-containing protein
MATEEYVVDVLVKGADVGAEELVKLAESADKASISTDKLTGKTKANLQWIDEQTGVVKKLVVEDGKLVSATESLNTAQAKASGAAKELAGELKKQDAATKELSTSSSGLGLSFSKMFAAIGAAQALTKFTKDVLASVEAIGQARTSLTAYTGSAAQAQAVLTTLQGAVGVTSSSLGGMTQAFATLQTSTAYLNVNAERIASILTNASNAMRAGGASAKEAAAGTNEFAKAMADGRITGQEFQEIQAKYPELARIITQETGMSAESIKVLGISSETAANALDKASEATKAKAEGTLTLRDRMNELIDTTAKAIDEFDKQTDASKILGKGITALFEAVGILFKALRPLVEFIGGAAITAIKAMATAVNALTEAIRWVVDKVKSWFTEEQKLTSEINKSTDAINKKAEASKKAAQASEQAANAAKKESGAIQEVAKSNDQAARSASSAKKELPLQSNSNTMLVNDTMYYDDYAKTSNGITTISGMRASGGPVSAGKSYIVGEEGPEVFTAKTSGTIIPNGGSGSSVGRGGGYNPSVEYLRESVTLLREIAAGVSKLTAVSAATGDAISSAVSAANDNGENVSGTSAINNFGVTGPTVAEAAPAAASSPSYSTPSTVTEAATAANLANTSNGMITKYAREYAALLAKNITGDPTDKQRVNNYLNAERYINSVPSELQSYVKDLAGTMMPRFRSGGSFTVPGIGSGTPDSKLVSMQVTPGEQVEVKTRAQMQEDARNGERQSSGGNTFIVNVETKDADSFKRSEKQILREFVRNAAKAVA